MTATPTAAPFREGANAVSEPGPDPHPVPYLEPWMRGTHIGLDPLRRAVVHALELTQDDLHRYVGALSDEQVFASPHGLPSIAFHLRHIVRSLDRLLTYTEGSMLSAAQLKALSTEHTVEAGAKSVIEEFTQGLTHAIQRVAAVDPASYAQPRGIGRKQLPTTVAGLLIHCAEHTQRHAGQLVTTAKLVRQPSAEGTA